MNRISTRTGRITAYIILSLLALISIFPLFFMVTNSFMGGAEFHRYYGNLHNGIGERSPLHFIPDWITFSGYFQVLLVQSGYLLKFWSSLSLSAVILIGQIVTAVLGGYAFSRFRFPGRDAIFFVIIVIMMLPLQVTLIPNYFIMQRLGLLNSYAAIILPGIFSAFGLFLMRQIMIGLPSPIFDAAFLDGAGSLRALFSVCLPNCKAGLAALVILSFADSYSMVEQPLIFLNEASKYPMAVFLMRANELKPELSFVAGILSLLPALLLFLYFKDEMIIGIEYSAVKA
jgi:multiple sugar transport system permease protein